MDEITRAADTFRTDPYLDGWSFDCCDIDLTPAQAVEAGHIRPGQEDDWIGCEGCPGWGRECSAVLTPPTSAITTAPRSPTMDTTTTEITTEHGALFDPAIHAAEVSRLETALLILQDRHAAELEEAEEALRKARMDANQVLFRAAVQVDMLARTEHHSSGWERAVGYLTAWNEHYATFESGILIGRLSGYQLGDKVEYRVKPDDLARAIDAAVEKAQRAGGAR